MGKPSVVWPRKSMNVLSRLKFVVFFGALTGTVNALGCVGVLAVKKILFVKWRARTTSLLLSAGFILHMAEVIRASDEQLDAAEDINDEKCHGEDGVCALCYVLRKLGRTRSK